MSIVIDARLFCDDAIAEETRAFNGDLLAQLEASPDMWLRSPQDIRDARLTGQGPFPLEALSPNARTIDIEPHAGPVSLRILEPTEGKSKGTFLHIHGGGWVLGSASAHDERLQELADRCQLTCVSVNYRLAPEHPYPAAPDDCESAALWLLDADHGLNTDFLAIGGESAGAHLSAVTMLRLRDRLERMPFHAAVLTAGVFDLGQTASARNWGDAKLVLNSRDMCMFAAQYLQGGEDMRDGNISPLYAPLHDLPAAFFSAGTSDLLLDDSLLMASRWEAANGNATLMVTPGGCHVFQSFRHLAIAQKSNLAIDDFLIAMRNETLLKATL